MHRCLIALVAACGTTPHAAAPPAHQVDAEPPDDPLVVAAAIADALRVDDGAGLPAVVDPEVGAWFWDQPGAYASPRWHVRRGATISLAAWAAELAVDEIFVIFAADLDRGIASHDLDPADPHDSRYVACDAPPVTGYLRTRAIGFESRWAGLEDRPDVMPAPIAYELHFGDTWLYLSRRGARLFLAHLIHSTCDA